MSFAAPLAVQPPTGFTYGSGVLIGNLTTLSGTPLSSSQAVAGPSLSGGVPVSAILELQSTTATFLLPRMTTSQRNALVTIVVGMMIYNSTTNSMQMYQGGSPGWVSMSAGAGGVVGPGSSTTNAIATYADTSGVTLLNSVAILDGSGNLSGLNTVANAVGTAAAPSYAFTGRTNTGMYSSLSNTLDFAADGTRHLEVGGAVVAVNYATITGSTTGNPVLIGAAGSDSNVSVEIVPKGTGALLNAVGATATPSYSFVGRSDTGFYSSAAATIDVATTGGRQAQFANVATAVNYLVFSGNSTASPPTVAAAGSDSNIDIAVQAKGTGAFAVLGTAAATAGTLKLWNAGNTFNTSLVSANVAANKSWTLPLLDATVSGAPLTSNASGVLSFANDGVLSFSSTLSSANIQAMYATPVQILAAAPANTMYVIHRFVWETVFVIAQANGGNVGLQYGTTAHLAGTAATATFANTVVNAAASTAIAVSGALAATARTSLVATSICISNDGAAFDTGTSTAKFTVYYSVVSI